jgi:hypothetical protein
VCFLQLAPYVVCQVTSCKTPPAPLFQQHANQRGVLALGRHASHSCGTPEQLHALVEPPSLRAFERACRCGACGTAQGPAAARMHAVSSTCGQCVQLPGWQHATALHRYLGASLCLAARLVGMPRARRATARFEHTLSCNKHMKRTQLNQWWAPCSRSRAAPVREAVPVPHSPCSSASTSCAGGAAPQSLKVRRMLFSCCIALAGAAPVNATPSVLVADCASSARMLCTLPARAMNPRRARLQGE